MRSLLLLLMVLLSQMICGAQELYVNTEPASNMAAKSVGLRLANREWFSSGRVKDRFSPEIMLGISKRWMVHLEGSMANYNTAKVKPESINLYGKYRFYSVDGVQSHFRTAFYSRVSYSRNKGFIDELNPEGDVSGLSSGFIVTQLLHKLALSSTVGLSKVFASPSFVSGEAYNYSFSAGYLLYPRTYTNYKQVNVNLYLELLGKSNPGINEENVSVQKGSNLALAPALQLIFNSQTRFDIGYKFDVYNSGTQMGNMLLVRLEYNLFNVW